MQRSALSTIVLQRLWQGLAGLVTVAVIAATLSQEQQGWYYTFLSVAALYSVFEMGLSAALLLVSAHMFVELHWLEGGRVAGDGVAEFKSFVSSAVRIYAIIAFAFVGLSSLVGVYLFDQQETPSISQHVWMLPWMALVTLTAFNMLTLPFLAVVEGTGEVAEVYQIRLVQGVLGAALTWFVLAQGGWLWATAMMPLAAVVVVCTWLRFKRPGLVAMVTELTKGPRFNWLSNIWPHQWRLALNWVSVFLMSQLATPILFYYHDPVVAGRMGLSLTIAHMLGILAQSWIARRVPAMSQAVVRREWAVLDHLFKRDLTHSLIVFVVGSIVLVALHQGFSHTAYGDRLLPLGQFIGLLGFVFFYHINGALSAQLRSFRREPLAWVSLLGSLLIVPGSLLAANLGSVSGVVLVMLLTQGLFVLPCSLLLWRRYNRLWRVEK